MAEVSPSLLSITPHPKICTLDVLLVRGMLMVRGMLILLWDQRSNKKGEAEREEESADKLPV